MRDFGALTQDVHALKALVVCMTDLLRLMMLKLPGEWSMDIIVGNSMQFGVPVGYGGLHDVFFVRVDSLNATMNAPAFSPLHLSPVGVTVVLHRTSLCIRVLHAQK